MKNIIYGLNSVQTLLQQRPETVVELQISDARSDKRLADIIRLAKEQSIKLQAVDARVLDKLANGGKHQGVVARVASNKSWSEADLAELFAAASKPLFLVLDGVQDPHNLGACLRVADATAVTAVIVPSNNAVGITPVVRKVASGAAETVPLIVAINLARCLAKLKDLGVWCYGTDMQAEHDLYEQKYDGPTALIMGAEGSGLRDLTRKNCDYLIKLPMLGAVESLNVSVATGVCLYEIRRQLRI